MIGDLTTSDFDSMFIWKLGCDRADSDMKLNYKHSNLELAYWDFKKSSACKLLKTWYSKLKDGNLKFEVYL